MKESSKEVIKIFKKRTVGTRSVKITYLTINTLLLLLWLILSLL